MEYLELTVPQAELVTRVAQAIVEKKRIVLWNIAQPFWLYLVESGLLKPLEYMVASNDPRCVGKALESHHVKACPINTVEDALAFKPDWILICDDNATLHDFFYAREKFNFGPDKIFIPHIKWGLAHHFFDLKHIVDAFVKKVPETIWGGINTESHFRIYEAIKYIAENRIPGDIVNFGVFRGWSMYFTGLIRNHFGLQDRKIIGFDTFHSFVPSKNEKDIYLSTNNRSFHLYSYVDVNDVVKNLEDIENTELIKGDLQQSVGYLRDRQCSLVFVDVDDYSPTKAGLTFMDDVISPGGVILHDHYSWPSLGIRGECIGERIAMDEFLAQSRYNWLNPAGTGTFFKCSERTKQP